MRDTTSGYPPSNTALTAAAARAAHLIVDAEPYIYADSVAIQLLGTAADELVDYHIQHGDHPVLAGARAQVVVRSRFAADRLAAAAGRGIDQYVVLGAGLDTSAYRTDIDGTISIFEVDRRETQEWKISRAAAAGLAERRPLTYVAVDFEAGESLAGRLRDAGFDDSRPAVVSWLGVTMYLTRDAIEATVETIAQMAPRTELIADFMLPPEYRDDAGEYYVSQVAPNAAQRGEPWLSFLAPPDISALLTARGLPTCTTVRQRDAVDARLWQRSDVLKPSELSVITHAVVGLPTQDLSVNRVGAR